MEQRDAPSDMEAEEQTPGVQIRRGFVRLAHWASRAEVRQYLYGSAAVRLSPADAALLEFLTKGGPVRISKLAILLGVDKSTITPQVARLEEKGLIDRQADPNDRRARLLTTSSAGLELQRRIGAAGAAALDEVLSTWSKQDRDALGALMVRFADQLSQHPSPEHRKGQ